MHKKNETKMSLDRGIMNNKKKWQSELVRPAFYNLCCGQCRRDTKKNNKFNTITDDTDAQQRS